MHRFVLLVLVLVLAACGQDPLTSTSSSGLAPGETSYPWQIHHVVVQTEIPSEGVQCGGAYQFVSGSCTCAGAPVAGYLDVEAYLPVWRCAPCAVGFPRLHIACLRGPADQLNPRALLNDQPWPNY